MKKVQYLLLTMVVAFSSCDYLDIDPVGQVIPHKVSDYRALLTKAYSTAPIHRQMLCWPSDEVANLLPDHFSYSTSIYNVTWQEGALMTEYPYETIYYLLFYANDVIDKIDDAEQDNGESKEQIKAEAYALRAYMLFELVNMYAKWYDPATAATDKGVPFSDKIDIGQSFPRHTIAKNYEQIFSDLERAESLMQVDVQPSLALKYRFSKLSLEALRTRIHLYRGEWQQAYDAALALAPKCALQPMDPALKYNDPLQPYQHTSSEVILALEKPITDVGTTVISKEFAGLYKEGDLRNQIYIIDELDFTTWEEYYVVRKHYSARVSFRASEVYLTVAETAARLAATQSDKLTVARDYLTRLQSLRMTEEAAATKKAAVDAMDATQLLEEIADERAREFIMEGHRWFDLRRTTRPKITKEVGGNKYTLMQNDPRYTLAFPRSAQIANPELNK